MIQHRQTAASLIESISPIGTYSDTFRENRKNDTKRLSTGTLSLDIALNGGLANELYILAAETSTGKSAYMMSMAQNLAENGTMVLYYALEMGRDELIARGISTISHSHHLADESAKRYTTGDILHWQYDPKAGFTKLPYKAYEPYAAEYFTKYGENLYIIESTLDGLTIGQIAGTSAVLKEQHPDKPIVVFVDYMQLTKGDPDDRSQSDRKGKIDAIVTTLKVLASQVGMPVLTMSSVARTSYGSKIGTDSFKESGDTEYTGGVLLGWNWIGVTDAKKVEDQDKEKARCEKRGFRIMMLDIMKYRNGARNMAIYYKYYPAYNYFEEISKEDADKIMKESPEKKQTKDTDSNSAKKRPKTGKTYAG